MVSTNKNIKIARAVFLLVFVLLFSQNVFSQKREIDVIFGFSNPSIMHRSIKIIERNDDYFRSLLIPGWGAETHIGVKIGDYFLWAGYGFSVVNNGFRTKIKDNYPSPWQPVEYNNRDFLRQGFFTDSWSLWDIWLSGEKQVYSKRRHKLSVCATLRHRKLLNYPFESNTTQTIGRAVVSNGDTTIFWKRVFRLFYENSDSAIFVNPSFGLTYRHGHGTQFFISVLYNFSKPFGYGFYHFPIFDENLGGTIKYSDTGLYMRVGIDFNLSHRKRWLGKRTMLQ